MYTSLGGPFWKAICYKVSNETLGSPSDLDPAYVYRGWKWVEALRKGMERRAPESSGWCVWRWYHDKMKEPRSLYPTYMTVLLRTSKHKVMPCRYTLICLIPMETSTIPKRSSYPIERKRTRIRSDAKAIQFHFILDGES